MNPNIRALRTACEKSGVSYQTLHAGENILKVMTLDGPRYFINWSTPLNDQATARLCQDKDYTSTLLGPVIKMPKTTAFLDPEVNPVYGRYRSHTALEAIAVQIENQFGYPLIIKRNSGSHGTNVFRVAATADLHHALERVFDQKHKDYDYVVLAQEYIPIRTEYRAIFLDSELVFAYRKDLSQANFAGNLSPFRWADSRAVLERNEETLGAIVEFMRPAFDEIRIPFVGADIAIDLNENWWLIELNSAPSFNFFMRDCGTEIVEELYIRILNKIGAHAVTCHQKR